MVSLILDPRFKNFYVLICWKKPRSCCCAKI
jgi:hypothetical protein